MPASLRSAYMRGKESVKRIINALICLVLAVCLCACEVPGTEEIHNEETAVDIEEEVKEEEVTEEKETEAVISRTVNEEEIPVKKPMSADYKDSKEFITAELGSYTLNLPGSWIDANPYYYSSDENTGAVVYLYESENTGFDEEHLTAIVDGLLEKDNVTEVKETDSLYIGGLKMRHAVYTQSFADMDAYTTLYVFVDPKTSKSILIMFMETQISEKDYTNDFEGIIHSLKEREEESPDEEAAEETEDLETAAVVQEEEPVEEIIIPVSTDYEDADHYYEKKTGVYTYNVPGNWIEKKNGSLKYYYVSEEKDCPYFWCATSKQPDITEEDVPDLLEAYLAKFNVTEILRRETRYIRTTDRIRTTCVKACEKTEDGKEWIHTVCVFADPLSMKLINMNFMEPLEMNKDYSKDVSEILNSLTKAEDPFAFLTGLKDKDIKYETDVLEYSKKDIDLSTLVSCDKEGVTFTTDSKVDLTKLGETKVVYTAVFAGVSQTYEHTFTVQDTKKPKIKIDQKEITLKYDQDFDPYDNIVSVKDPVDGDLEFVSREPKETGDGYYWLEEPSSFSNPGYYEFIVHACDRHGNKTTKKFTVRRKNPPKPKYDYVVNINTGKFHLPDCRDLSRMKEKNKWYLNKKN